MRTTCGATIWSGFFGYNENGDHEECYCEIEEIVEEESVEFDEHGPIRPCYPVDCPECGASIEGPQEWELIAEWDADFNENG